LKKEIYSRKTQLLSIDEATEYLHAASNSFVPHLLESNQLSFILGGSNGVGNSADRPGSRWEIYMSHNGWRER